MYSNSFYFLAAWQWTCMWGTMQRSLNVNGNVQNRPLCLSLAIYMYMWFFCSGVRGSRASAACCLPSNLSSPPLFPGPEWWCRGLIRFHPLTPRIMNSDRVWTDPPTYGIRMISEDFPAYFIIDMLCMHLLSFGIIKFVMGLGLGLMTDVIWLMLDAWCTSTCFLHANDIDIFNDTGINYKARARGKRKS